MSNFLEGKSKLITSVDYKKPSVKISYWIIFAMIMLASMIALFPVIWAFLSGFKELDEYFSINPTLFPKSIDLETFLNVWVDLDFIRVTFNTIIMYVGVWFAEVFVGGVTGYVLSRLKPKGSRILFTAILWTMMMPTTVSMVPADMNYTNVPFFHVSLQNTYIPFWLAAMASCYDILLFKNFFDSIPKAYVEAATIDGCSTFGIFSRIIVPLSKPIIATITIFTFSGVWNNFLMPYLLIKDPTKYTIGIKLYKMTSEWTEPEQMLAAVIALVPPIIVFLLCAKKILNNGVNVGVKE